MKKLEDPTTLYRQKIANVIYTLSGIKRDLEKVDTDIVVLILEQKLKRYIKDIFDGIQIHTVNKLPTSKKRKRGPIKEPNVKAVRITDIYNQLEGTPEYYGVRRCIILKKISTSLGKNDAEEEIIDDEEEELQDELDQIGQVVKPEVTAVPTDRLQQELAKLNDGSRCFARFEKNRLEYLHILDQLTTHMSLEEYLQYNRYATSKFIDKIAYFDQWIGWKTKFSKTIYVAIGWLCVNKLRNLLYSALARRRKYIAGPFYSKTLDRLYPLNPIYFVERENDEEIDSTFGLPAGYISSIEKMKDNQIFTHYNDAFADNKQKKLPFSLFDFLKSKQKPIIK